MPTEKINSIDAFGLPKEFCILFLTIMFILMLVPYLGGIDFGVINIPVLSESMTSKLRYLGPILFLLSCLLYVPVWNQKKNKVLVTDNSVDDNSKYAIQSITEIMKSEAASKGLVYEIEFNDDFNINDLFHMVANTWFPTKSKDDIHNILFNARGKAFGVKYAVPKEDEKLVDVSYISFPNLEKWENYLFRIFEELGITDLNSLNILNVGIGNGYAEEPLFSKLQAFKAVDISEEALQKARSKYPRMTAYKCDAEVLEPIANNSIDLYISLRVYQSTLFDHRAALLEAYRVLRNGGIILLSVPVMFLKDKEVLKGLIPHKSKEPSMEYANKITNKFCDYLNTLNFKDVKIDDQSPFEIYIYARR